MSTEKNDESIEVDYRPRIADKRYGIGIVGAGSIVQDAHLPAYRKADLPVAGIYDLDEDKARSVASDHDVDTVYSSLEELLSDGEVDVVDIAVPPWNQKQVVREVVDAGLPMLCQKPLSHVYREAVDIVEMAEEAGLTLAVNQQMRFEPLVAASHDLIERGWIGDPVNAHLHVSIDTPWETWPWLFESDQLDLMYHSIHYFDSMRHLFGDPSYVYSSLAKYPEAGEGDPESETRSLTTLDYENGLRVTVMTNHNNWTDDSQATLRVEGTEGLIKGTIGLLHDYPEGGPDTIEYCSRRYHSGYRVSLDFEEGWFPDAFIGSMGDLQRALEEDRPPINSGRENLGTLQIVNAGYLSHREKRAVSPGEIHDTCPSEPLVFTESD